ncbi:hypothetical protein ACJX0J_022023, partial [Zea mays]
AGHQLVIVHVFNNLIFTCNYGTIFIIKMNITETGQQGPPANSMNLRSYDEISSQPFLFKHILIRETIQDVGSATEKAEHPNILLRKL